jgi:site-specific DNA-methyltransferase (cytosine-N4-specific)
MAKLHTTESAAAYLQVTPARVRQLIMDKRIKSDKYGRDHLIPELELKRYATSGKKKAGRPPKK